MNLGSLLSSSPPSKEFTFRPPDNDDFAFKVELVYLNPADVAKLDADIRSSLENRFANAEASDAELREVTTSERIERIFLPSIRSVSGMKVGALRTLVALDAQKVAAAGGPNAAANLDRPSIKLLMQKSQAFFQWVATICTDIGRFQDKDWADQLGNSASGQSSTTAETQSPPTSPA